MGRGQIYQAITKRFLKAQFIYVGPLFNDQDETKHRWNVGNFGSDKAKHDWPNPNFSSVVQQLAPIHLASFFVPIESDSTQV